MFSILVKRLLNLVVFLFTVGNSCRQAGRLCKEWMDENNYFWKSVICSRLNWYWGGQREKVVATNATNNVIETFNIPVAIPAFSFIFIQCCNN